MDNKEYDKVVDNKKWIKQ